MRIWARIREAFEDSIRQQVTRLGFAFSLVVALVGLAAFVSANNLLFLLLAVLLSTMLISGFVSRLGLAGLELDVRVPEHVAARRKIQGRLIVRNCKFMTPSFSLQLSGSPDSGLRERIYIPVIRGRSRLDEPVELYFARRGICKNNTFEFTSRFPFGFTQRRARLRLKGEVLVYPSIDPQPGFEALLSDINGQIESRQRGVGSDFYRIRPYEYLESARHVDWRATAHTGELQVREFTREQEMAVTLFLDLNVPADEEQWFEHAVDCAAFVAWRLNERGTRLRFLTQRFDRRIPEDATVYEVLRYLALAEPVPGAPLIDPDDDTIPIAISTRGETLVSAGWLSAGLHAGAERAND